MSTCIDTVEIIRDVTVVEVDVPTAHEVHVEVVTPVIEVVQGSREVVEVEPPERATVEVAVASGSVVLPEAGRRDHVLTHRGRARSVQALSLGGIPTSCAPLILERRARVVGLTLRVDAADVVAWRMDVEAAGAIIASLTLAAGQTIATVDGLVAQVEALEPVIVTVTNETNTARSRWRATTATLTLTEN